MRRPWARQAPLWLSLLATALLVWIYTYGITKPLKWEEPRRCLVAMEMIHRGDYVVPRFLGEPYLNKPPLQNWLIVLFSGNDLRRVGPVPVRAVTLAALLGIAVLLWRLGLPSRAGPHALPALVFLTFGIVVQFGRTGEIDILFTFFVIAALASFEMGRRRGDDRLRWLLPQVLLAGGVLTKGIAPVFFYPPALYCAWRDRRESPISVGAWAIGLAAFVAIFALWIVPYSTLAPIDMLTANWAREVGVLTVSQGMTDVEKHFLHYPIAILGVGLPWSLCLLGRRTPERRLALRRLTESPYLRLCSAVAVWTLALFVFVPGMRERYLLPMLPCAAVLFAAILDRPAASTTAGRPTWSSIAAVLAGAAWTAGMIAAGRALDARPVEIALPLVLGLGAIAALSFFRSRVRIAAGTSVLALLGLLYGIALAGVFSIPESRRNRRYLEEARALRAAIDGKDPVVVDAGVNRKLAYALTRELGRPVQRPIPSNGPYYRVSTTDDAPARSEQERETGRYAVRRIPGGSE